MKINLETSFEVVRYNPKKQPELTLPMVECYRSVFATSPWDEWMKCQVCGCKWGISQKQELAEIAYSHCGKEVVEFWPVETVLADINHEITDTTSAWLAIKNDKVIGFSWGYAIPILELQTKLGIDGLVESIKKEFNETEPVAYQDEIGVVDEFRGWGVAKAMFRMRHISFLNDGLKIGVVRTKKNPPSVTNLWFNKLGYRELLQYNDADQRIIMATRLDSINVYPLAKPAVITSSGGVGGCH